MAEPQTAQPVQNFGLITNPGERLEKSAQELADINAAEKLYGAQESERLNAPIAERERQATNEYMDQSQKIISEIDKKFEAPQMQPQDYMMHATMMAILGTYLGKGGQQSAQGAIAGMTGYLKGVHEGNKELTEKSYKEYQTNLDRLKTMAGQLKSNYETYLKQLSNDREQAKLTLATNTAMYGSGVAGLKAKLGATKDVIDVTNSTAKQIAELTTGQQRLDLEKKKYDFERMKEQYEFKIDERGNIYAINKNNPHAPAIKVDTGTATFSSGKGSGGYAGTADKVLAQDAGNAVYNMDTIADKVEQTHKIPGGSFAFSNSFKGDLIADARRYWEGKVIDPDLQEIDALLLNTTYDIASGGTGGRGQLSDTKVKTVGAQMPLDSQPDSVKLAKWKALVVRLKEIDAGVKPSLQHTEAIKKLEEKINGWSKYVKDESPKPSGQTHPQAHKLNGRIIVPNSNNTGWVYQDTGEAAQ